MKSYQIYVTGDNLLTVDGSMDHCDKVAALREAKRLSLKRLRVVLLHLFSKPIFVFSGRVYRGDDITSIVGL